VIYIIEKYKESAAEKEMIEKMQLRQEFDNLKEKVNPHFLFNSFNTLSSLISEDKQQAEKFLDELSKVYRYLLRNNESGMSTVDQETRFIRSYARLLETRYGDGFKMEIRIDNACKEKEIPSLTLQLLVENAVKHNIINKNHPVRVVIYSTADGYLVIENNLNKKTRLTTESTGIGLSNIREKYRLLHRNDVFVLELPEKFIVKIPLLP
jgi:two-component system, LytTR family, sensor kinase